ncbi:MAG TPA: phosphoribosylglycinamide formyltransferase [Polyangiaceae bacterium]|nr:phosphoribosylglycinamide formyltransferase [Polyangiaceae bacterium]
MRKRIAVLASHAGTVLQAIIDACESKRLDAGVCLIVSNNSGSGAVQRAARHHIPFRHLSGETHADPAQLDQALCDTLRESAPDVVFLAGYMKRLGTLTLTTFAGRIYNTHPSLLPRFGGQGMYGAKVHQAVLAAGDRVTGVTVHNVDAEYDTGPIVAQCEVPVYADDTPELLAARVQEREREFVVETLQRLLV